MGAFTHHGQSSTVTQETQRALPFISQIASYLQASSTLDGQQWKYNALLSLCLFWGLGDTVHADIRAIAVSLNFGLNTAVRLHSQWTFYLKEDINNLRESRKDWQTNIAMSMSIFSNVFSCPHVMDTINHFSLVFSLFVSFILHSYQI